MQRAAAGVVASGCPYTAKAAIFAYEKGGNAVDAAIAAQLVACVSEPLMTGLNAGGMVMMKYNNDIRVLDGFGCLPGLGTSSTKDLPPKRTVTLDYDDENAAKFLVGAGSVASTNLAAMLETLHKEYASLPLSVLAEPAIQLAESEVVCSPIMACGATFLWPIICLDPVLKKVFSHEHNSKEPMKEGEMFCIPNISVGIRKFVEEGASYFSTGEGASLIIKKYNEDLNCVLGGQCSDSFSCLRKEDLATYSPIWRTPITTTYKNASIFMPPPPSQSGVLNINTLRNMEMNKVACSDFFSKEYILALVSALRCTETYRETEKFLLSDMVVDNISQRVSSCPGGNTTHFSVADKQGNVVGITSSLGESAGVLVSELGLILNNFLGEESLMPEEIHFSPGDRLLTMCCPTIVKQKETTYVLGSAGSDRIRTAVLQGILALVDGSLSPEQISKLSRFHVDSNTVKTELPLRVKEMEGWAEHQLTAFLATTTHLFATQHFYFGGMHMTGVTSDTAELSGGADPRRSGTDAPLPNYPDAPNVDIIIGRCNNATHHQLTLCGYNNTIHH